MTNPPPRLRINLPRTFHVQMTTPHDGRRLKPRRYIAVLVQPAASTPEYKVYEADALWNPSGPYLFKALIEPRWTGSRYAKIAGLL